MVSKVRDNHIVADAETARDLFGVVRGPCQSAGCDCGRYWIRTTKYRQPAGGPHPDCNVHLLDCDRCGHPSEAHCVDDSETQRERGNDAMALGEFDTAIIHYTEAISLNAVDWRLYSNRSLCYSKKKWWSQALTDADRAVSLQPDTFKVHYRRAVALMGSARWAEAMEACERAMELVDQGENRLAVKVLLGECRAKCRAKERVQKVDVKQPPTRVDNAHGDSSLAEVLDAVCRLERSISALVEAQRLSDQRMERIESGLAELLKSRPTEGVKENKAASPTSSVLSSSDSDLSETIAELQRAWEEHEHRPAAPPSPSTHPTVPTVPSRSSSDPEPPRSTASPAPSSGHTSRRTTQESMERQARVDASRKRMAHAELTGELLQVTELDILTQIRRGACTSADCDCKGFKIYYNSADVHNTEIMFFCSLCGCESSHHEIDTDYARQQAEERAREEREARERAARAKSKAHQRGSEASRKQEALAMLELDSTATRREIRAAFKRAALKFHPDKAGGGDRKSAEETFQKIKAAYDVLIGNL